MQRSKKASDTHPPFKGKFWLDTWMPLQRIDDSDGKAPNFYNASDVKLTSGGVEMKGARYDGLWIDEIHDGVPDGKEEDLYGKHVGALQAKLFGATKKDFDKVQRRCYSMSTTINDEADGK